MVRRVKWISIPTTMQMWVVLVGTIRWVVRVDQDSVLNQAPSLTIKKKPQASPLAQKLTLWRQGFHLCLVQALRRPSPLLPMVMQQVNVSQSIVQVMMHLMALIPSQGWRQIHLLMPKLQQISMRMGSRLTPAPLLIRLYNFITITLLTTRLHLTQGILITVTGIPILHTPRQP